MPRGRSWRKAVICRSPNVSEVQQETRTWRSIGLHMSQSAPENLRELPASAACPFYPRQQTSSARPGMSDFVP